MDAWPTVDGTPLHRCAWPVAAGTVPRGTVLLVHGLGEHSGRYAHVAAHLNAHGWAVTGYDQRGHGRSPGRRGAMPAADSLLADLGAVLAHTRAQAGGRPPVLLGHSLGGLVVGRFVAEGLASAPAPWWQPVDGLVMSSPALDAGLGPLQRALLATLGTLSPDLPVGNGLQPGWVCSDAAVVRAYLADPLVHDRVTARVVRLIVDGGALVRQRAPQWRTPTLLLWAGADRCVRPAGSAAFAAAAPAALLQAQCYDGWSHEIFNEPGQTQPLTALTDWLTRRF
jgi:alpha-beta hydrolase superfamily lysophospholipase